MKDHLSKSDTKPLSVVSDRDLLIWRKKLDDSKAKSKQKEEHFIAIQQQLTDLDVSQPISSKDTGNLKNIRILENRLDKAIIKLNEATSI